MKQEEIHFNEIFGSREWVKVFFCGLFNVHVLMKQAICNIFNTYN